MKTWLLTLGVALALVLVGTAGRAQESAGAPPRASQLARGDADFLEKAMHNSAAVLEHSRLALERAGDPGVRRLAQRLVDEHTVLVREVESLARTKGEQPPEGPSLIQSGRIKLMTLAEGENFDRKYLQSVGVDALRSMLIAFRNAGQGVRDADLKAFAARRTPMIQQQLRTAQNLYFEGHDPGRKLTP